MIWTRRRVTERPMPMRRVASGVAVGLLVWLQTACSLDSLLKTDKIPPGTTDPAITETHDGALAAYNGEVAQLRLALGGGPSGYSFVPASGVLSDELRNVVSGSTIALDLRQLPEVAGTINGTQDIPFLNLNQLRGQGAQAIGLLTRYAPEDTALVGHTYAIEGYAEVMLAELYCSGIPLSTLDYGGDYTLRSGSATAEVLIHAAALFDTAMTFVGDSTQFLHLAEVGKGRALLGLGRFADAAAAVAAVPDDYRYDIGYSAAVGAGATNFTRSISRFSTAPSAGYGVADREGGNGLDYISSGDPRTASVLLGSYQNGGFPVYRPAKYAADGSSSIVLASGVEARLIEAEAALQAGDAVTWLAKLNALRTNPGEVTVPADTIADTLGVSGCGNGQPLCGHSPGGDDPVEFGQPAGGFPVPSGYSLVSVDTTYPAPSGISGLCNQRSWYRPCYAGDSMVVYVYVSPEHTETGTAGTGGVSGLDALADPGTPDGRVDLLFRERAFWLFLTGHRQGDMRRLIRQYGRTETSVYPVGPYPGSTTALQYGHDVTVPIPVSERNTNTSYTSCISRGA